MILDPDKIFASRTGIKIKILILLAHITLVMWMLSSQFNFLFFIISAPILWFLIAKMGMEVGFHRYFCHKSFQTGPIREKLLLILGMISSTGSSLTWVAAHRVHHRYADRPGDPQNSNTNSWWKNWLTIWTNDWSASATIVKDLMRDPWHRFCHRNYFKILLIYVGILSSISLYFSSWIPIIVLWSIPVVMNFNMAGFLNSFFHHKNFGYTNYQTNDDSRNHAILNLFMAGGGLHNNHHANPDSYTFNTMNRWWEPDFTGWFIKNFLMTNGKN